MMHPVGLGTWSVCWCGTAGWLLGKEGDRECSLEQALKRDGIVYSWYFPQHFGLFFFLLSAYARRAFLLRETELVRSVVYCSFAESTASWCYWPHCSHQALLLPSSLWDVEQVNNSWSLHTDWMLFSPVLSFFEMDLFGAVEQSWGEPLSYLVGSLSWNS